MKTPRLKIAHRLLAAFGIQIALLAGTTGYAVNRMHMLEKHVTEAAQVNQHEFALASEMKDTVSERFRILEKLSARYSDSEANTNTNELDAADQRYINSEEALASSFALWEGTSQEELLTLTQAKALHQQVSDATSNLLRALSDGDRASARRLQADLSPQLRQWRDALTRMEKIQLDQNAQVVDESSVLVARAHWVMLVAAVFSVFLSIALAWNITCGITGPINRLLVSMGKEVKGYESAKSSLQN